MMKCPLSLVLVAASSVFAVSSPAAAAYNPNVAVVLCPETYAANENLKHQSHKSSQGMVGLAGLVGVPYDTLVLDQLLARPVPTYSSIWFSSCSFLTDPTVAKVTAFLSAYLAQGGTVLLDGPIGAYGPPLFTAEPIERAPSDSGNLLNVQPLGPQEVTSWVIRNALTSHPLATAPGWEPGTTLTQGLAESTEAVGLFDPQKPGSYTLLELTDGKRVLPYLVTTRVGPGRVLAISGYGTDAGPATPFRNEAPKGFFDNLLLPHLIDAALWLMSPDAPAVGLQLSAAPLTVVVRLDADQSDSPEVTVAALDYLVKLGRETGVTSAYAVVSGLAEKSRWNGFFPRVADIEQLGGSIGSHSHTHNQQMSKALQPGDWDVEVRGSMDLVRQNLSNGGFHPAVQVYINPGDEIEWGDYRRFFRDVRTFFTHGFETEVPYGSGISGFDLPAGVAPVALLADVPAPDFQWFYEKGWIYSVEQATQLQTQILGYYQNRIGRGALYNQMWHDYGLANSPPRNVKPSGYHPVVSFFDASRDHFAHERIFTPGISEVTTKLHIAQSAHFSAQADAAGLVTTTLDLSSLAAGDRRQLAGMGLRVNGVANPIIGVTIDGVEHAAFTRDTVILPPTEKPSLVVAVQTGAPAAALTPHLTYLSKPPGLVDGGADQLYVEPATPGLFTRFCLVMPPGEIILGADQYWADGNETCGFLAYDSPEVSFETRAIDSPTELGITATDRRITDVNATKAHVILNLAAGYPEDRVFFKAKRMPLAIFVGNKSRTPDKEDGGFSFELGTDQAIAARISFVDEPPPAGQSNKLQEKPGCAMAGDGGGSNDRRFPGGSFIAVAAGLAALLLTRRQRRGRDTCVQLGHRGEARTPQPRG
jgi:hypothetical protein